VGDAGIGGPPSPECQDRLLVMCPMSTRRDLETGQNSAVACGYLGQVITPIGANPAPDGGCSTYPPSVSSPVIPERPSRSICSQVVRTT